MARILIAATPDAAETMLHLLTPKHTLTTVNSMFEASIHLKRPEFDLIMIDVLFDESRMFELLGSLKNFPENNQNPVICFSARDTLIVRKMYDLIESTCNAFGAWMYLDQNTFEISKETEKGCELVRLIERCLVDENRKATNASRVEIQKQREALLKLRLALDEAPWTPELEEQVSEFRARLADVLLVLSELQITSIIQSEIIAESAGQADRVTKPVTKAERSIARDEKALDIQESEQLGKEQEIVPDEEYRAKLGRRLITESRKKNIPCL